MNPNFAGYIVILREEEVVLGKGSVILKSNYIVRVGLFLQVRRVGEFIHAGRDGFEIFKCI